MRRNESGFRKLIVWQEAMKLVIEIYKITRTFPSEEKFHLVSQMRRAATSITANIAEGSAMASKKHKDAYYCRAKGSATEIENFIEIAKTLEHISEEQHENLIDHVARVAYLLHRLIDAPSKNLTTS